MIDQGNPYLPPQAPLTVAVNARPILVPPADLRTVASGLWYLAAAFTCLLIASFCWGGLHLSSLPSRTQTTIQVQPWSEAQAKRQKQTSWDGVTERGIALLVLLMYVSCPLLQLLGYVRLCRAPTELNIRRLALLSCLLYLAALLLYSGSALLFLWLYKQPLLGKTAGYFGAICGVSAIVTLTVLLERLAAALKHPIAVTLSSTLWKLTLMSVIGAGVCLLLLFSFGAAEQKAPAGEQAVWVVPVSVICIIASAATAGYCAPLYLITVCSLRKFVQMRLDFNSLEDSAEPTKLAAAPLPLAAPVIADGLLSLLWGVRIVVAAALFLFWLFMQQEFSPGIAAMLKLTLVVAAIAEGIVQFQALATFCRDPLDFPAKKFTRIAGGAFGVCLLLILLAIAAALTESEYSMLTGGLAILCSAIYQTAIVLYLRRVAIYTGDDLAKAMTGWLRIMFLLNILLGVVLSYFVCQFDSSFASPAARSTNLSQLPMVPMWIGLVWLFVSAATLVLYVTTIRGLRSLLLRKLRSS